MAGNVIAAGSGYVVAFDERTALRRWSLRLGRNGDAATVRGLATAAGRLLAGGAFARNLVEIDPRRGVVKPWRLPHRPSHGRLTPLPGRATIVGLGGGRLYLAGNVRYPLRLGSSNLASLELATRRVKAVPRVAKFQSIGRIAGLRRHVLAAGLFAVKFR